jgi:hypothetical protein
MPDIIGQILQRLEALETAVAAAPRSISIASFSSLKWRSAKAGQCAASSATSRRESSRHRMAAAAVIRGGGSRRWSNTTVRLPPSQS